MSASEKDERVARLVRYSGRVQGVGFRATTVGMAQQYAITGWVRNLPDGRVELLVEGPEPEIDRFLKHLHEYWSRYILDEQIEAQSVTEQSAVFEVRR